MLTRRLPLKIDYLALTLFALFSGGFRYFAMANGQFYVDEDTYASVAYSLLHGHLASASSFWTVYLRLGLTKVGTYTHFGDLAVVEPWLDHPPLVPILLVPLLALGASPRLLPIVFSSSTSIVLYFLLRRQRALAWTVVLVWNAFFLTNQILSMLFIDAGVAFFNLLTVTFTNEYAKTRSRRWLYLAGIAAGSSALSKEFGIASTIYLAVYAVYMKLGPHKEGLSRNLRAPLLALIIASLWPVYSLIVSTPLFLQLLQANVARSMLSGNNFRLLLFVESFSYTQNKLSYAGLDVVLLASWIAIGYSLFKRELHLINLSLFSYLLVIVGLRYTWFYTTLPLFPFFAIALSSAITDSIRYMSNFIVANHLSRRISV